MIDSRHTPHYLLKNRYSCLNFSLHRSVLKHRLTHFRLCPQSRPGSNHASNEKVLRGQSLLFSAALSEQVEHSHISLYFFCHRSLLALLLSSRHFLASLLQVHLLFWRFAVRYHQNEQQSSVPPPGPHSITTKLPGGRRSVLHQLIFHNSLLCCHGNSYV